jgi:hypothetical protein
VASDTQSFEFLEDLQNTASRQLAFLNVPAGYVMQLRVITTAVSIDLRGATYPVRIPSGTQTGLKIDPVDGVPFEVRPDERTGARIIFAPFDQLIRNGGHEGQAYNCLQGVGWRRSWLECHSFAIWPRRRVRQWQQYHAIDVGDLPDETSPARRAHLGRRTVPDLPRPPGGAIPG